MDIWNGTKRGQRTHSPRRLPDIKGKETGVLKWGRGIIRKPEIYGCVWGYTQWMEATSMSESSHHFLILRTRKHLETRSKRPVGGWNSSSQMPGDVRLSRVSTWESSKMQEFSSHWVGAADLVLNTSRVCTDKSRQRKWKPLAWNETWKIPVSSCQLFMFSKWLHTLTRLRQPQNV